MVKNLPAMQETQVPFLGQEKPLEKGKATHFSIFAWRIPWTGEPGRLQPMGWQRVTHDLATTQTDVLFILLLIPSSVLSICLFIFHFF